MKKIFYGFIPLAFVFLCASCGDQHEHSFAKLVDKDKDGHWMACECQEKQRVNHNYGDWSIITEPTEDLIGKKERKCQICEYIDTQDIDRLKHEHQFASEWVYDELEHFHQATCEHEDEKGDAVKHQFKDGICTTCGAYEDIQLFTFKLVKGTAPYAIITGFKGQHVTSLHFPTVYQGVPVQEVSSALFIDCDNLENIYYDGSLADWCKIQFVAPSSNPMYKGKHFFLKNEEKSWEEVTKLAIPDTIEEIGNNQFYGFENVSEVSMKHIQKIGTSAFASCSALNHIEVSNLTVLEHHAFSNCSSLEQVILPAGVLKLGSNVFEDCIQLTSITLPGTIQTIEDNAFEGCSQLVNIYFDGKIEEWCQIDFSEYNANPMSEQSHFYMKNEEKSWEEVTSLVIPKSVTKIKSHQFENFTQLTAIVLPETLTEIGDYAFFNCTNITTVVFPEGLISIGQNAFSICANLKSVVLPKSLKTIGDYCFLLSRKLTAIYYQGSKEEFDQAALNIETTFVYYYSLEKPETSGKYWHYVEDVPTIWA